jgi:8-oxo-dGTP diphosphatase
LTEKKQQFRSPSLATDGLIVEEQGILLAKRSREPFKDKWCLPGGFVDYGEKVEDALKREFKEETGLEVEPIEIIGVYSDPNRDPRKHVVNISWLVRRTGGEMKPLDATSDIKFFRKIRASELAFDHAKVLKDAGLGKMLE